MKKLTIAFALIMSLYKPTFAEELPTTLKKTIEYHVQQIMDNGNAKKLSFTDFDHGHLILRNDYKIATIDDIANNVICILYHTRESEIDQKKTYPQKKERSLIGYPDGRVVDAKDVAGKHILQNKWYRQFGTIYDHDIAMKLNGVDSHKKYDLYLHIRPQEYGECNYKDNRFDVYLRGEREETRSIRERLELD